MPPTALTDTQLELRLRLRDITPEIWRRLAVPADLPLGVLHEVLQVAMGWKNSHGHDFLVGNIRFAKADVEDELFSVDEAAAPLGAVASVGAKFLYRYDLGDDWVHEVTVERFTSGDAIFECTGGARACPPEDCGGAPGYARLLRILREPTHPEHERCRALAGTRFDAERFERAAVNKKLGPLGKRYRKGR